MHPGVAVEVEVHGQRDGSARGLDARPRSSSTDSGVKPRRRPTRVASGTRKWHRLEQRLLREEVAQRAVERHAPLAQDDPALGVLGDDPRAVGDHDDREPAPVQPRQQAPSCGAARGSRGRSSARRGSAPPARGRAATPRRGAGAGPCRAGTDRDPRSPRARTRRARRADAARRLVAPARRSCASANADLLAHRRGEDLLVGILEDVADLGGDARPAAATRGPRRAASTLPRCGVSSPFRHLASVVLPEPFCPMSATNSPLAMDSDTSRSASALGRVAVHEAARLDERRPRSPAAAPAPARDAPRGERPRRRRRPGAPSSRAPGSRRSRSSGRTPMRSRRSTSAQQRRRRVVRDDAALGHQHQAVGALRRGGLVLDEQDRRAARRAPPPARRTSRSCRAGRDRSSARRTRAPRGSRARSAAIARRCFSPPESVIGSRPSKPCRPTTDRASARRSRISSRGTPSCSMPKATSWRTVGGEELRLEVLRHQPDAAGQIRHRRGRDVAAEHLDRAGRAAPAGTAGCCG